jgi:type IV secretory pathway VirB9-like protein
MNRTVCAFAAATLFAPSLALAQALPTPPLPDTNSPAITAPPPNPIEAQEAGQFPEIPLRRQPAGGSIQEAWNDADPNAGIQHYVEPTQQTMRGILREGFTTAIVLTDDEILSTVLGDSVNFDMARGQLGNVLYVWPTATGYDTNLTVETASGRVLSFYLRGETFNTINLTHTKIYVGGHGPRFDRGPERLKGRGETPAPADEGGEEIAETSVDGDSIPLWTRYSDFDPLKIRHDLEWSGDTGIAPKTAFRDDKFTYLYWGEDAENRAWPAVWKVEDGIDKPARIRRSKDGAYLVIEHTGSLTLRRGEKTLCIRPIAA